MSLLYKKHQFFRRVHKLQAGLIVGIYVAFIAIVLISMFGCSSALMSSSSLVKPDPNIVYRYDLFGSVNGMPFKGVAVVPYAGSYTIRIESKEDVDLFTATSCAKDFLTEDAIKNGWFKQKRGFEYTFTPAPGIENRGVCLLRLGAYKQSKGQNAWGILDFETPESTLPAKNICNGEVQETRGVSICQSKVGLIQRLVFESPVKQAEVNLDPRCKMNSIDDGRTWQILLPAGECVMAFMELGGSRRIHRHTTVAYTDILIRGGQ